MLVLDEAQAVKNPLTHAAQTARQVTPAHRVALTGTPVENRLDDLWSIMHILNPGLLGTRTGFRRLHRHADRAAGRARGRGGARPDDAAVPPSPAEGRPGRAPRPAAAAGLDRVLHAHGRAGGALPGDDRRDDGRRPRRGRDRAARPRARPHHAAEAGVQPPAPRAGEAGHARPAARASSTASPRCSPRRSPRATPRSSSRSTRSWAAFWPGTSSASSRSSASTSTGRRRARRASASSTASRSRAATRACS